MRNYLLAYYLLLTIGIVIGLKSVKKSTPDFLIVILLIYGLSEELLCDFYRMFYHNNIRIFHLSAPLEFFIICLYYNYAIAYFKKRKLGIWIGIFGIILGLVNTLYIQDLNTFPSVFMLFEAFCIIGLSMYSYFTLFRQEDLVLKKSVQFWATSLFLLFWSFTFVIWGVRGIVTQDSPYIIKLAFPLLCAINMVYYGGFLVIFINYNKLIPSGEQ